jgi:hypothetical protein
MMCVYIHPGCGSSFNSSIPTLPDYVQNQVYGVTQLTANWMFHPVASRFAASSMVRFFFFPKIHVVNFWEKDLESSAVPESPCSFGSVTA